MVHKAVISRDTKFGPESQKRHLCEGSIYTQVKAILSLILFVINQLGRVKSGEYRESRHLKAPQDNQGTTDTTEGKNRTQLHNGWCYWILLDMRR